MLLLPIAYTDKLAARFKQSALAVHLPKIRRDIATETSLIQFGTINTYMGRHGVGSIAPAASQAHGLYSLFPSNINTADVTTIAHIQVVQALSGNEYVCGHYATGVLVLAIQLNATGKIGVFVGANSSSSTTINTNITPVIGESYCVAHRQVNGQHTVFVNGVKTNDVSLGYNGNSGGSFTSNNINYATANTNSSRQLVYYAGKFKDVFTDAELLELTKKPQQIFEPEQQLFYFNVASGVIITGDNSSQSTQSSTEAVTQTHVLSGDNSSHSSTSTSASISQTHVLTGDNSSQDTLSSTGAVSTDNTIVLSGDNSSQSTTSASASISQTHVLTGNGSSQSTTSSVGQVLTGGEIVLTSDNSAQNTQSSTGSIIIVGEIIRPLPGFIAIASARQYSAYAVRNNAAISQPRDYTVKS